MDEHALVGGMNPSRGVVRVGDTVRRPGMRAGVRELLVHLEQVGFSGAPRYLGADERERHVVSWVDGDVPVPPYPDWAMTDPALASLGRLVREYHDAVASFSPVASDWSSEWADPSGGPVICHNDLFPENVVFRDGLVVALIDFDMAGPGRPLWDLAIAAEEWAPLHAPGSRLSTADGLDAVHRFEVLAGAYGLARDRAAELLDIVAEEKAHSTANVLAQAAAGDPVWTEHIEETSFTERMAADLDWFVAQRPALLASVHHLGRG
ncbi:MAG TPA: phosphotransferase [Microlunatus sp.]